MYAYANRPLPPGPPGPDLDTLIRNLDLDTVRSKRLIDQLLDENEAEFLRRAATVLKKDCASRGARYLLGLLSVRGLLAFILCDPGICRERALELARVAASIAPQADILLARALAESAEAAESPSFLDSATRLLEILAGISDSSRIFPYLARLLRHPNPHLRSKIVLTIGRANPSAQWVRHRLGDADPRIRANALESLWDVDTQEARTLLQSLVQDPNNRVAGNAVLGLYRVGEASAIPEILKLARNESNLFRSTAAWVVGETEDPRFTEVLLEMLRDSNATVRKRAFASLGRIRAATARAAQLPPYRLAARFSPAPAGLEAPKTTRRLLLAVSGQNGWMAPALLPTHVLLSEDGKMVTHYRLTEKPLSETIAVVFLLPVAGAEAAREAALACLPWKRPGDLWACDFYDSEAAHGAGATDRPPRFQSGADLVQAEFARELVAQDCPDLGLALRRCLDRESRAIPANPRLIVFAPAEIRAELPHDLAAASAARAFVQVIAPAPDPALEDFCAKAGGLFRAAGPSGLASAAADAYIQQLTRYEVVYQPVNPGARNLKVRLHGPALHAATEIPIPD